MTASDRHQQSENDGPDDHGSDDPGPEDQETEPIVVPGVPGYGPPPILADPGGPAPAVYGIPPELDAEDDDEGQDGDEGQDHSPS